MNLLIVDDEMFTIQGIMEGVRWELLEFGEVLTAKSYVQAVELFKTHPIDIVLSDIEMAEQSGLDLIEWVNENYPKTECIIISCHSEFDFARRAVSLNCLDYVLKPIPYEKLTEILRKAIQVVREEHQQSLMENYGKVYMKQLTEKAAGDEQEDVIEQVTRYIRNNISDSLSVETLAKMVYVSPDHLTRMFKKQFHQTVSDYILQQRMVLAGELLKSRKMSVTMVSAEVGYGNYSYFIKLFRKAYGMTPREYQQEKNGG